MMPPKFVPTPRRALTASIAYEEIMRSVYVYGDDVKSRDGNTKELLSVSIAFDMHYPIVAQCSRRLNYRFMAAEALWILNGRSDVEWISNYNKKIADFSDDGITLAGAYGPKIINQLRYVVEALVNHRETRQAVITTWERNPAPSKDVPCTVALTFNIRRGKLNCHAFMRSSDVWLGVPYDFFSFTAIAMRVLSEYNTRVPTYYTEIGTMYFTAVSSHIYDRDLGRVEDMLSANGEYVIAPIENAHVGNIHTFVRFKNQLLTIANNPVIERPPWCPITDSN